MYAPYRVEYGVTLRNGSRISHYTLCRSGEGELVHGDDPVLLNKIADLLNAEPTRHGSDDSRPD